jgi:ArsR family transcriptional regulator
MKGRQLRPALLVAVAARFKVLSEPARLAVLNALRAGPLHVSALMAATGLSQANLSKHLRVLHAEGLLSRRREGLFVYYEISDRSVMRLCDLVCGAVETRARRTVLAFR